MSTGPLIFGSFELNPDIGTLLRCGEPLLIGQRATRLLQAFLERPGEVLTKSDLIDAAWSGAAVEESNLSVQIASLRKALGLTPEGEEWIATIPRIGYRFAGHVEVGAPRAKPANLEQTKPSLAVLPFATLTEDPEQGMFADGLVEDIITTLSKLSGLTVIARNSSFAYKGRSVDVRKTAKELGVRYVMEGSVRKSGDQIRIAVQLVDGQSGGHVWAERYDRKLSDIFAIEDEITLTLATEMQVHLLEGEQARLRYTTTTNVEAWNYWIRAVGTVYRRRLSKEDQAVARINCEKALALDPGSAPLNAILAQIHVWDARFGWWDDRPTSLAKATAYAERALRLDPESPEGHAYSGMIRLLQRRFDDAIWLAQKAVELAPGSADVAVNACWILTGTGRPHEAVLEGERAMKLNPFPPPVYFGFLGNAYRLAGRIDEAITALETFHARAPENGVRDLVIAYERAGRHEEARGAAARLLAAQPRFTVSAWIDSQFRSDTLELESDIAALRAAGLRE